MSHSHAGLDGTCLERNAWSRLYVAPFCWAKLNATADGSQAGGCTASQPTLCSPAPGRALCAGIRVPAHSSRTLDASGDAPPDLVQAVIKKGVYTSLPSLQKLNGYSTSFCPPCTDSYQAA